MYKGEVRRWRGCVVVVVVSRPRGVERRTQLVPVAAGQDDGRDEGPDVQQRGKPRSRQLDPHRREAVVHLEAAFVDTAHASKLRTCVFVCVSCVVCAYVH